MANIDNSIIDFCKQLEIYIKSDYYKGQISIGAFSTRFDKFLLTNERAKDHLFMIDVLKGEASERHLLIEITEEIKNKLDDLDTEARLLYEEDEKDFQSERDYGKADGIRNVIECIQDILDKYTGA